MSISASIIRPITRSINNPILGHFPFSRIGKAVRRYFSQLDPVQNSHYELDTPITFTGAFEVEIESYLIQTGVDSVLVGNSSQSNTVINHRNSTSIRVRNDLGASLNSAVGVFSFGILNTTTVKRDLSNNVSVKVNGIEVITGVLSGTFTFNVIGTYQAGLYVEGILANPRFTDKSDPNPDKWVTTTLTLGNATGDTEISKEGNNSATYNFISEASREQYTLYIDDSDANFWLGVAEAITNNNVIIMDGSEPAFKSWAYNIESLEFKYRFTLTSSLIAVDGEHKIDSVIDSSWVFASASPFVWDSDDGNTHFSLQKRGGANEYTLKSSANRLIEIAQ